MSSRFSAYMDAANDEPYSFICGQSGCHKGTYESPESWFNIVGSKTIDRHIDYRAK